MKESCIYNYVKIYMYLNNSSQSEKIRFPF